LLFWFVISKAIENIIIDKSSIVKQIIHNSTSLQLQLYNYIQSVEYQTAYNKSIIDKQIRYEFNINLTWQWMQIPFTLVICILGFGLAYTFYIHRYTQNNTLKLDKTDIIILMTVFLSFLTEVIFIFVLVTRYEYVSDMNVIIFLMNSDTFNNLLSTELSTESPFSIDGYTYTPFSLPPL